MKCMSCETEINPKWKHAIDANICPFCGNTIMDISLRNLLHSLRENLEAFPQEFSAHLDDWLFSNYNYIKADSSKLIQNHPDKQNKLDNKLDNKKFLVKVDTENGPQEIVAEKIQSDDRTKGFFERAEVVRPNIDGFNSMSEKADHLKKIVQKIKKTGSSADEQEIDQELMAQMAEDLKNSENISIQSSLSSDINDDDEIPSVVLNMANQQKGSNASNIKDLMSLQQMQDRLNNSKKNFESGENRGKGGFGRV
jgi:Zn-finger nucleic acid-binding protein